MPGFPSFQTPKEAALPRYDYQCEDGHTFELKQSFSDEAKADCPVCGKAATRQFSVVPIVFKGSGWYVNDYGKKGTSSTSTGGKDGADGDSSPKADGSSKPESKDGAAKAEKPAKSESSSSPTGKGSREKAGSKSGD